MVRVTGAFALRDQPARPSSQLGSSNRTSDEVMQRRDERGVMERLVQQGEGATIPDLAT